MYTDMHIYREKFFELYYEKFSSLRIGQIIANAYKNDPSRIFYAENEDLYENMYLYLKELDERS